MAPLSSYCLFLPTYSTAAGLAAVRAAVKAEKAARGAPPEDYERTDGELNWRQRADLVSELAALLFALTGKTWAPNYPSS